jgi:hypothetical protein
VLCLIVFHTLSNKSHAELYTSQARIKVCICITSHGGGGRSKFAVLRGNFTGYWAGLFITAATWRGQPDTSLPITYTGKRCQSGSGTLQVLYSLIDSLTSFCHANERLTSRLRTILQFTKHFRLFFRVLEIRSNVQLYGLLNVKNRELIYTQLPVHVRNLFLCRLWVSLGKLNINYVRFQVLTAASMKAARTSETSVDNYFTRQYIPGDNSELNISCCNMLH